MDFDRIIDALPSREEMAQRGQAARLSADDSVTPEVGHTYTVSPSFTCGDRSWLEHLWRVKAISGPNAMVEIVGAGWGREGGNLTRLFRMDERAWYLADHMESAIAGGGSDLCTTEPVPPQDGGCQ